ncbi:Uncharacterized protein PBTT_00787 [Plasmodiophora brassicae]
MSETTRYLTNLADIGNQLALERVPITADLFRMTPRCNSAVTCENQGMPPAAGNGFHRNRELNRRRRMNPVVPLRAALPMRIGAPGVHLPAADRQTMRPTALHYISVF